jgi:hypothetical protein
VPRRLEHELQCSRHRGLVEAVSCRRGHLRVDDLALCIDLQDQPNRRLESRRARLFRIRCARLLREHGRRELARRRGRSRIQDAWRVRRLRGHLPREQQRADQRRRSEQQAKSHRRSRMR